MNMNGKAGLWIALVLAPLLCAGCLPSHAGSHHSLTEDSVPRVSRPRLPVEVVAEAKEPTDLQDLISLATSYHPDMQAAHARIEAARGRMIQAGLHPNPTVGPRGTELLEHGNAAGQAGAIITQQFVTANKLGLARDAGARAVEAMDWQSVTKWFEVATRVRLAYFELLTALSEQDTINDIVKVSEESLQAVKSLEKQGVGVRPDILRANVELEQNRLRKETAQRRVEAARQNLHTALGRPPVTLTLLEKNRSELELAPPDYDWNAMLECVKDDSSELQEARALVAQAERLVDKAHADMTPNIDTLFIPYVDTPTKEFRFQAYVAAQLPLFNRNQGNIRAAEADLMRTRAEEQVLELRLTERLTAAYQRYQVARDQAQAYENIVKGARESLKLINAGYQRGDPKYDYTALLQAQQVLFQTQLSQTTAKGDLWRAVIDLASILQQENLQAGCGVKK